MPLAEKEKSRRMESFCILSAVLVVFYALPQSGCVCVWVCVRVCLCVCMQQG